MLIIPILCARTNWFGHMWLSQTLTANARRLSLGLQHSVRQYGLALIQIREKVYEIRPASWLEFGSRPYDIVEMAKGKLWKIEEENWTRKGD